MLYATLILFVLATISAWSVARKRCEYLPIAALLTLGLLGDLCGELIRDLYLDAQPRPYLDQPAWALFHVEQALFLAWPAGVVAVALHVLAKAPAVHALYAWSLAVCVHMANYPEWRDEALGLALRVECGIAVAALGWCVIAWSANDRTLSREPEHAAALALTIAETTVLLFVHTTRQFENWWYAQLAYAIVFAWMIAGQVRWLWTTR